MQLTSQPSIQRPITLNKIPNLASLKTMVANFKGVCFDMDGTLLNSEPLHARAIWQMLPQKPVMLGEHSFENEEELNHYFCGQSDGEVFETLKTCQPHWQNWGLDDFSNEKNNNLLVRKQAQRKESLGLTLVPEMMALLKELNDQGVPCALVSASQYEVVDDFVRALELESFFKEWIGATADSLTKPHPDPYLKACEILGLNPRETLAFEDSQTGLISAQTAGLQVLQASWFS